MWIARFFAGIFALGVMIMGTGTAYSQDYPSKPIRLITPAAGGGADFTARQIAQGIAGPLGQPVIVDNRGGALIQGELLSKTPPDGYGLVVSGSSLWITPVLRKAPYDALDFSPITQIERSVYLVAVQIAGSGSYQCATVYARSRLAHGGGCRPAGF